MGRTATITRYGKIGELFLKELSVFIEDTGESLNPRSIPIEGEEGFWLLQGISNPLSNQDIVAKNLAGDKLDPTLGDLLPGVSLIDKDTYIAGREAHKATSIQEKRDKVTASKQRQANKEVVLKRLGVTDQELDLFRR